MSERRVVPVAYVTKWAGPIWVVRDAEVSKAGYLFFGDRYAGVDRPYWTEYKSEAERRWRANALKNIEKAQRAVTKAVRTLNAGPTFEERK